MSSFLTAVIMTIPILFLYSSRIESNRVVTITKPLVITQARKTPAYYLYQHAHQIESRQNEIAENTSSTFLSTENTTLAIRAVVINEMKFDRQEVGSSTDYGFRVASWSPQEKPEHLELTNIQAQSIEAIAHLNQPKSSPTEKWATVKGKFELKDGVGVVDHIVELKRVEEGQVRELGQVDLKEGKYSIDIETPQGYLIAQIKDRNGTLIGEDQQKISKLLSQGNYFEGPYIRVGRPAHIAINIPAAGGTSGTSGSQILASNPRGSASPSTAKGRTRPIVKENAAIVATLFSTQHQLEEPTESFGNVSRNSSTVAALEDTKKTHYKLLTVRQTADENETPLFKKNWVDGMTEYIADQMKIQFRSKNAPIIIGRVMIDNKPAAGIQVQIENHLGVAPVYLDQFMIPNVKQDTTSENGYFVFVGLEREDYIVTATKNKKIIGHQLFVTEEGSISFQNISTNSYSRSVLVRSFDAFTGRPVATEIVVPNLDEILEIQKGVGSYRTQNGLGLTNYIVRPKENYMAINYIQDGRKDHAHIPAIREEWLTQIQINQQINDQANTGTIIGFVPDMDYDMYLVAENYEPHHIIYFNQTGEITEAPVRGGGFILYNVPVGAIEVVVQEKKTERIHSQVHIVRASQTSVSHFTE